MAWIASLVIAFIMDYIGGGALEATSTILFWLSFSIACFLPILEFYKGIKENQKCKFTCIALSTLPVIATIGLMIVTVTLSGIGSHRL